MPNWCVGTLKVRGDKDNIREFLVNGFEPAYDATSVDVEDCEDSIVVNSGVNNQPCYIKGLSQTLVSGEIRWYTDQVVLVIDEVMAAWSIDVEGLVNLSERYQLDFKIYAFESEAKFNLDIEIHKGKIIKNKEVTFTDYSWECINPILGG